MLLYAVAGAGQVHFAVYDSAGLLRAKADLLTEEQPTARPLKLAGRSGAGGADTLSGLYDNLHLVVDCSSFERWHYFDTIDESFWGTYGSPSPRILDTYGNPAPCLMTSGDSWHDSGLYSLQTFDWTCGFTIQADVRVDSAANFHNVEFRIADRDVPEDDVFGHVIGINWKTPSGSPNVIQCVTDADSYWIPTEEDWLTQWMTIVISFQPSNPVEESSWGAIKALYR